MTSNSVPMSPTSSVPNFGSVFSNSIHEPSPETRAVDAATGEELRRALGELQDEQRHALVLRYYADLSVPEIARATGWREGTVKSRLHRALARMRSLVEGMNEA